MKWICPHCPELNHGTRHESIIRHIRRKHQSIGEPINLNPGLIRRQMVLDKNHYSKPHRQAFYLGGFPQGQPLYNPSNTSEFRTFDVCDLTEKYLLRPLRQRVELMNLMNQCRINGLSGNLQNGVQSISDPYLDTGVLKDMIDLFGCKVFVCNSCCSIGVQLFYFPDLKEVKSRSTKISHTCPAYSYTKLNWIS
jgi:hypothetical protein